MASGSKANCYTFCDGTATILIECGLPYLKTLELLNWKLPDAILITHEHGDHDHVHDGRPHVHLPDGTVRYLEEGELPSAPKRRRSPAQE